MVWSPGNENGATHCTGHVSVHCTVNHKRRKLSCITNLVIWEFEDSDIFPGTGKKSLKDSKQAKDSMCCQCSEDVVVHLRRDVSGLEDGKEDTWLTIIKKVGSRFYFCKQLDSVNNLNDLKNRPFPKVSRYEPSALSSWFGPRRPWAGNVMSHASLLTYRTMK